MAGDLILVTGLGLAVGSFLTLAVERYDTAESLWIGRSHCTNCRQPLRWWELLPIVSYLALKGKCQRCDKRIPAHYPLFELITGLGFLAIYLGSSTSSWWIIAAQFLVLSSLLFLAFYDWFHQAFPSAALLVTAVTVLLVSGLRLGFDDTTSRFVVLDPFLGWLSSPGAWWLGLIVGGFVVAGLLGALAFPSKGRWMGYGDVLLGAILGLWLGYPLVVVALLLAFYSGALFAIIQLLSGGVKKDHRIPFGPFLIFGAIIAHSFGISILTWLVRFWSGG